MRPRLDWNSERCEGKKKKSREHLADSKRLAGDRKTSTAATQRGTTSWGSPLYVDIRTYRTATRQRVSCACRKSWARRPFTSAQHPEPVWLSKNAARGQDRWGRMHEGSRRRWLGCRQVSSKRSENARKGRLSRWSLSASRLRDQRGNTAFSERKRNVGTNDGI